MRSARSLLGAAVGLLVVTHAAAAGAADAGIPDAAGPDPDAGAGPWIEEPFPFADAAEATMCISGVGFAGNQALAGDPCFDTSGSAGTSNQQGSVHVLERQGDRWVYAGQNLVASDGAAYDNMGQALAVDGDTAIFGASSAGRVLSPMGNVQPHGAAWIFVRSGGGWTQAQKLLAPDAVDGDYFGDGVAISKDTIAVGAPRRTVGSVPGEGTVYIYARSGAQWSLQQEIVLPQLGPDAGPDADQFGGAIALDGDTLLAGASQRRVGINRFQGSAFVYTRSGATWSLQQQVLLAAGAAGDHLGTSVALQGDRAVIGATGVMTLTGTGFPFTRTGAAWNEEAPLPPTGVLLTAPLFGLTIAMDGNLLLLGAPQATPREVADEGIVAAFAHTAAGWQAEQLFLPDTELRDADLFGRELAIAGNHALIKGNRLHAYTRTGPDIGTDGGTLVGSDGGLDVTGDGGSGVGQGTSSGPSTTCDAGDCAQAASPVGSSGCGCRVGAVGTRSWGCGAAMLLALFALRRRSRS